jgi:ABC-type transport system involved in multi-copper enzyme maturation permease subunit
MSSKTTPAGYPPEAERPGSYRSPFGQELAPSAVRADEPNFARIIGMVALCAVVVGSAVIAMNWYAEVKKLQPRLIPSWAGWVAAIFGIGGLLFHAARDADVQIRRTYGAAGALLVLLAIVFCFVPSDGQVGAWFLPIATPAFLLGLFFLLPFARHEDDPFWRRNLVIGVTVVGAAMALTGLIGGEITGAFLLPNGAVAAFVGWIYLWAAIGLLGTDGELGYRLALGLGVLGVLVIIAAAIRSIAGTHFFVPSGLVLIGIGVLYAILSVGICSERQVVVLARRELAAFFYSPIAYLVLFGMVVVCWINYFFFAVFLQEQALQQQGVSEPILRDYVGPGIISFIAVPFIVPVLTMRLLSEEQRTGTIEVMLTAPVNEPAVVLSKFLAGLIFFLLVCLPVGLFLIPLRAEGGKPFDVLPLASFVLAVICSGAAFVAMGLFFSSLTRNQIVAAVLTFMAMIALLAFYVVGQAPTVFGTNLAAVVRPLSYVNFWTDSLGGKLLLRDVVGQLSMAIFWLFLTAKVLESRKWK